MNKGTQYYRHIKSSSREISLYLPLFMFILMACVLCIGHGSYFKSKRIIQQSNSRNVKLLTTRTYMNNANVSYSYKGANYDGKCFQLSWKKSSKVHTMKELIEIKQFSGRPERTKINLCRHIVIIDKEQATIGHFMFNIASIIGIAYAYDLVPIIHKDCSLKQYFDLPNVVDTNLQTYSTDDVVVCRTCGSYCSFTQIYNSTSNITLKGYLQSWKFFENVKDIIRDIFRLKPSEKTSIYFESVTRNSFQHVCINVRRFRREQSLNQFYDSILISFIKRAKQFYAFKFHEVDFLITTNDKDWSKKNVPGIPVSPFENVLDDMGLMTLCDHVIVTSGSIGWWGAWLSGGTIAYLKGYSCSENVEFNPFNEFDYFPLNWIGM